jgi:hypothetical protein
MTMAAAFDTLKYAEALKAGGIPEPQAKVQATALADALKDSAGDLVTKHDLKNDLLALENRLGERLAKLENTTGERIARVEERMTRMESHLSGRLNLLQWMVGTVAFGILLLLVRVFWPAAAP